MALSTFSIILTPTVGFTVLMADSGFENTRYPERNSSIGGTCDPFCEWKGENFSPVHGIQPERTMYHGHEERWQALAGSPDRQWTSTVAELGEQASNSSQTALQVLGPKIKELKHHKVCSTELAGHTLSPEL